MQRFLVGLWGACVGLYPPAVIAAPVPERSGRLPRAAAEAARQAAPTDDTFDTVGAGSRLDRVAALVERSNAPTLVGPEKWTALLSGFRAGLDGCRTHAQFAAVVNRLFSAAGVSHFRYYTNEDWAYWHVRSAFGEDAAAGRIEHVGLVPERIADRWFVRGVLEGGPADGSTIRVGDELVSVDGEPFAPVASFRGKAGEDVSLTLRRTPTSSYDISLRPIRESLHRAVQRAIRKSIRVIEKDGLRFAYMHGWTLLGSGREYDDLAELQDDVDGLLLDYRDGVGGTWMAAQRFLVGTGRRSGAERARPTWRKPVVVLTDDGTRSAKEIVVDAVKRTRRGPLVGEPTPGHVTAVGSFQRVGDDALMMLPGFSFELEGHPTLPDYPVPRDIRYCGGDDPQYRKGVEVLTGLVAAESAGSTLSQQR